MILMGENKTKPSKAKVREFLEGVENERRREDGLKLLKMMKDITREKPVMWGNSIVGFGNYHYKYASGREGDWFKVGFSPRKQSLTLYLMPEIDEVSGLLEKLGKHKTGKGCLYINRLDDVDTEVLKSIIKRAYDDLIRT